MNREVCFFKIWKRGETEVKPSTKKENEESPTVLQLSSICKEGACTLSLTANNSQTFEFSVSQERLQGNVALVSHGGEKNIGRYGFSSVSLKGSKLEATNTQIGPIIGSQYTLSKGTVKLTAQFAPISANDPHEAILEIQKGNKWEEASRANIIEPGYTAEF